ncbi:PREDICTED: uncharacterized protein LOC106750013 [Dinoponera quadriceps]|uniref:Uncharacterized protein LOC106750013 n=1 Tax=Dinoponera quadriceps TaxID=609295 RepID=A0A6P3Y598_DINQU|nr:PREDICTED: uncharacterized protein LOC106750013 [Dinoponera quadriceps]
MCDEIVPRSQTGGIPYADEDADVASWLTGLTNAEAYSRDVQSFTTFRASGPSGIARRELPGAMSESPKQRHTRQSSSVLPKRHEGARIEVESALQRYENALLKYQKPKLRPKRQISRERQQQSNNCSSSDESVARNKSKSTSSIDTQSVNNILDEYEDLDYRRSSELSDVGSISVTNFEAVMMDQQKRQSKSTKIQPVLKVNQQTQVRQRSRDRQETTVESGRTKMPEILLRKGEVQKRVDEWLNQAQSQNFPATREKPLTRSNSSAEQKSQRRYHSRSNDEAKERLNGGASSSYDDLSRVDRKADKVNKIVYKEYLAVKNRHGGSGPASRIPQRRAEETLEERNGRSSRMTNLARGDRLATVASIIPCRRPSLKRSDQSAARRVKEETAKGDQGEPISPNKDGESRRPADKAVEAVRCKSTEAPRCAEHPRDSTESSRRRLQTADVRREAKIDRREIYGAVGARVRAFQAEQSRTSSFKPNDRAYTSASLNERNVARSKARGYASPDHVERIYERALQPQVIHADDLESVLRPALQMSAYGEKAREGRQSPVKALESELFESRHPEHLETIEEDDRKSESSACRYPEIGLKQCLKVQQNGRIKWDRQQVDEPARTFATFRQGGAPSRSSEMIEEVGSKPTMDRLTIHSRENSDLSTVLAIPLDELLESQEDSNRFQIGEKDRTIEELAKDVDRGAVVSEVLVKNLQFQQDLPGDSAEQPDLQQVSSHDVLCDDYENDGKRKDRKMCLTKEQTDHQRLIAVLKKGDFEMLKVVSALRYFSFPSRDSTSSLRR